MGRWVGGRWVGWSVGKWSVIGWSVVVGSVVSGFNKTLFRISLFQSSVAFIYRNCPTDILCKSVDWFLYSGNTGLNGKVDAW